MKTAMTYDRACEILGLTTPKSLAENARLAAIRLRAMTLQCPLKYEVACEILIRAAK